MAKIHKMIVYFLDVNDQSVSMREAVNEIKNLDVGCGTFIVFPIGSGDMGEWHDDHELNGYASKERFDTYIKK